MNFLKNEWNLLRLSPSVSFKRDALLVLLPALLWYGAVHSRPTWIDLRCANKPQSCTSSKIFFLDRFVVDLPYNERADQYSQWTQAGSGYFAFAIPLLWHTSKVLARSTLPVTALSFAGADLILIAQTSLWNGLTMEVARVGFQRPRPFVYQNPSKNGQSPAHYTSFWSGHTSFAAAANTALFFALVSRGAPISVLAAIAAIGGALTFLTGLFRVVSLRHFPTDVLIGALAGFIVAYGIARLHRKTASDS